MILSVLLLEARAVSGGLQGVASRLRGGRQPHGLLAALMRWMDESAAVLDRGTGTWYGTVPVAIYSCTCTRTGTWYLVPVRYLVRHRYQVSVPGTGLLCGIIIN